jgi:hypothetical protein
MSLIERAIAANQKNAGHYDPSLANKPAPKVVILTCMDPRVNQLLEWLNIKPAEAYVIRNVGTAATEDVVRSLMFFNSRSRRARDHDHRAYWLRNGTVFGRRVRKAPSRKMRRMGSISR